MTNIGCYQQRIQRKINPGDKRFNVNTLDFDIENRRLFFHNDYCYDKKYDFILLKDNILKIGLQHQHLTTDIIDKVIGAGSIIINRDGLVVYLDNQSGTFQMTNGQQQQYIEILHEIVLLNNALIYDINYHKVYDPINPNKIKTQNRFYNPIIYNDQEYGKYIKILSSEKWRWVLSINQFDYNLYKKLNMDLDKPQFDNQKSLYYHFKYFGQYEMGRCMGYYK